jgi:hypothetical protein
MDKEKWAIVCVHMCDILSGLEKGNSAIVTTWISLEDIT